MVRQSQDEAKLHRSLGQALAAYRKASSVTQNDLARKTNYDRTSIAHIEAGRQSPPERVFWETVDDSVGACGALVDQYDVVCDLKLSLKQDELKRTQATHRARADNLSLETVHSPHNTTSPGDSLSEEGDHTERRDALRLGLVAATAPEILRRVLREAANEAMEFTRRVGATGIGSGTFDHLELVIADLGSSYSRELPAEQFAVTRAYRVQVQDLIEGRHTLKQERELYIYAAWLDELLAWMAHDLGSPIAAHAYAIDCFEHANQAGHNELCAWASDAMASIAMYSNRPDRAVKAVYRGIDKAADDHPLAVRLRAQAARAHARQGQRLECEALFVEANELYDRLPSTPPLHYGVDTIALADYALTSYPASAYIWLGEFEQAKNCAQQAIALHQNVPVASRSPSREAIARIDLGIALAALGAPDEAVAQGRAALASSRVVDSVRSRAGDLAVVLVSRYPRLPESQQFQDQVRELTRGASI